MWSCVEMWGSWRVTRDLQSLHSKPTAGCGCLFSALTSAPLEHYVLSLWRISQKEKKRKEKQNSFEQPFSSGDWWLMFYLCSQQMQPSEKNSARRRFSQLFRMRRKTLPQWSNSRYSWQYLLFGHFAVSTLCRKENSLVYMSTYSTSMLYCCVYLLLRVLCCTCSFIFLYWIIVFQFLEKKLWLRVKEIN